MNCQFFIKTIIVFSVVIFFATNISNASDWKFEFVDTFDGANNVASDVGLNDNSEERQLYGPDWQNVQWVRRNGVWYDKPSNSIWSSQVNHIFSPDVLSFHLEPSAVMLNKSITSGKNNAYHISVTANPVKGNDTSTEWVSIMLDDSSSERGWISEANLGFLIRANGGMALYQNGVTQSIVPSSVQASDSYEVELLVEDGKLTGFINGTDISANLSESIPDASYVYLGTYIIDGSGSVSSFDDLVIKIPQSSNHLKRYGYFFASGSTFGEHLFEVIDYTNFNWIESSDYIPANLQSGAWKTQFVDTFDGANNSGSDVGLNDNNKERQSHESIWLGAKGVWTRRNGTWYEKPSNSIWSSQVNHIFSPDVLSFHAEPSAVMLDKRITSGKNNAYHISVTANPVKGNNTSTEWVSIMLDDSSSERGWITQVDLGFLIRANGGMALYQNGAAQNITPNSVETADLYEIELLVENGQLTGSINGTNVSANLSRSVPDASYVYLGSSILSYPGSVSSFDNFIIKTPIRESTSIQNELILQVRWEFFSGISIREDYQVKWDNTLSIIEEKKDFITAIYLMDEPIHNGISFSDYETVLEIVKEGLMSKNIDIPVYTTFAPTTLNGDLPYFAQLDGVGFDYYPSNEKFFEVENYLEIVKSVYPRKPIFLFPQTYWGDYTGTDSDAEVAEINWRYYNLALSDPQVFGLLNFDYHLDNSSPTKIPITLKVQKLIGEAILKKSMRSINGVIAPHLLIILL